ncbi:MAG: BppU family phage baseplate upper protein, partial [Clostridia bacterium]|nr:BppU family phage baseplate upper protein [Clostridia bacterium]
MKSIQKINVDISRDRNLSEPSVYAKQNDSNSREVEVTLYDNGVQLSSLTTTGKVFFGKGANAYAEAIEISNGVTEFTIPQNALSSPGRIQAEILILNADDDTETLTSASFAINCRTQINPSGSIDGENNGDYIEQIVDDLQSQIDALGGVDVSELQTDINHLQEKVNVMYGDM